MSTRNELESQLIIAVKPIFPTLQEFIKELKSTKFDDASFEKTGPHTLYGFFDSFRLYSGLKESDLAVFDYIHEEEARIQDDEIFHSKPILLVFLYLINHFDAFCRNMREEEEESIKCENIVSETKDYDRHLDFYRFFTRCFDFLYERSSADRYDLSGRALRQPKFKELYINAMKMIRSLPRTAFNYWEDDEKDNVKDDPAQTPGTYNHMRTFIRLYIFLFEACLDDIQASIALVK